jgi:ferredoxin
MTYCSVDVTAGVLERTPSATDSTEDTATHLRKEEWSRISAQTTSERD